MIKYLALLLTVISLKAAQPFGVVAEPITALVLAPTNLFGSNVLVGTNMHLDRLSSGQVKVSFDPSSVLSVNGITNSSIYAMNTNSAFVAPVPGKILFCTSNYNVYIITPTKTNLFATGM